MFKINQSEVMYVYQKVTSDYDDARTYDTVKSEVVDSELVKEIIAANAGDAEPLIQKYTGALIKNLKVEYITTLRGSLRSYRSRERRKFSNDESTSMSYGKALQDRINKLRDNLAEGNKKLTQAQVVEKALDAFEEQLAKIRKP